MIVIGGIIGGKGDLIDDHIFLRPVVGRLLLSRGGLGIVRIHRLIGQGQIQNGVHHVHAADDLAENGMILPELGHAAVLDEGVLHHSREVILFHLADQLILDGNIADEEEPGIVIIGLVKD